MATEEVRLIARMAWWWRWYATAVVAGCWLTGLSPDPAKLEYWARRAIRIRYDR